MSEVIHESVYDFCEKIYDDICYSNNNCHDDEHVLRYDLDNFIDNIIDVMTIYVTNTILLSYGIDRAVSDYSTKNNLESIATGEFSKTIIKYLIKSSFIIEEE